MCRGGYMWWGDLVRSPPWRWRGSWQSGGSLVGRSPVYTVSQHLSCFLPSTAGALQRAWPGIPGPTGPTENENTI